MKSAASPKLSHRTLSPRAASILAALRNARKSAVKMAKMHHTPVIYLRAGTLVRERA
jgi:hypothetical protein